MMMPETWSAEYGSLAVQITGVAIGFILGTRNPRFPVAALILLGVATNFVAQILIMGGGEGAFVGMILLPIYCLLANRAGRLFRRLAGY